MLNNIPESAQYAYSALLDSEDEASEMESRGMAWCDGCYEFKSSTRDVKWNGFMEPFCRDCRPFDRPCEACGKAEAAPGLDGCVPCTIEGDLYEELAEIAGMA
jgi:hypothetical protein